MFQLNTRYPIFTARKMYRFILATNNNFWKANKDHSYLITPYCGWNLFTEFSNMGAHDYFLHLKIKIISQKNTFSAWYRQSEGAEQTEDPKDTTYSSFLRRLCPRTGCVVLTHSPQKHCSNFPASPAAWPPTPRDMSQAACYFCCALIKVWETAHLVTPILTKPPHWLPNYHQFGPQWCLQTQLITTTSDQITWTLSCQFIQNPCHEAT